MNENKFELAEINTSAFDICEAGKGATVRESTTGDTATLFNAVSGGSEPVKNVLNEVLNIVNIVVTSTDVNEIKDDETSPIINRPVVHFFTDDNRHFSSLSNGIVRTTKNLLSCGLVPTPDTPIKIRFKTVETKKGTAHIFELA